MSKLEEIIEMPFQKKGRFIFFPPTGAETKMTLGALLKENPCQMKTLASVDLDQSSSFNEIGKGKG